MREALIVWRSVSVRLQYKNTDLWSTEIRIVAEKVKQIPMSENQQHQPHKSPGQFSEIMEFNRVIFHKFVSYFTDFCFCILMFL